MPSGLISFEFIYFMENVLIVIPAHNEESTIGLVIDDLFAHGYLDILVVDDYSNDNTAIIARDKGVKVISLPYNMGAWKASQAGLRYAYLSEYKFAITFDADQQHLAKEIKKIINSQKESQVNITIGSCLTRGTIGRHLAWKFFQKLSGVNIKDLTSGFRLYDKKALRVLSNKEATLLEYQDVGVLLMLKNFGVSKGEVDVLMQERTNGISRIFYSWWAVIYYLTYTTLLCLSKIAKTNKLIN